MSGCTDRSAAKSIEPNGRDGAECVGDSTTIECRIVIPAKRIERHQILTIEPDSTVEDDERDVATGQKNGLAHRQPDRTQRP